MSNNQSDTNSFAIYKLFFDDIEEIFLDTISFRTLSILTLITCLFILGILILLFYRSTNIFFTYLNPFIYGIVFYDFIQLLSLILLKYNFTEQYFNKLCRWPYYLKSSSETGQCLTIISLLALSRHQIRYFLTHHHLSNSSRLHSRALTFGCLLFIIYINNWITHLKVEKLHLITLNETKYEINIQELPISIYDISEVKVHSHQRFIIDLNKYTQGYEKNLIIQNRQKITNEKIIHNHKDGSIHEIIIKFPLGSYAFNTKMNRTKRKLRKPRRRQISNKTIDEYSNNNNSYRINRCTYGQTNFSLANFLSLIHSISYLILLIYYLTTINTFKIGDMTVTYQQQLYDKSISVGRKKSAERHKHFMLLIHLKQFLYLIIYSHTLFTFLRLIYICLLTIILCSFQTPFKWFPVKVFFYSLFLISYFSIPLRMGLLFIYLFLNQFSTHIQSIIFYIFHTKLRFSWKLEKPTVCFRLQFTPYIIDSNHLEHLNHSVGIDISSSIDEDHSNVLVHDSMVVYDENSSSQNGVTTNILINEPVSNVSAYC